ncbi:MAG TPA: DUF1552 domain-containing protein [Caulobacteraceae bacterium]|nr:DUF1552 domain-containing protein [Caulobacteraceae bacterium]
MIIKKLSLDRRALLRSVGATIALPLLDAMTPALARAADKIAPAKRLGVMYVPNGMSMDYWTPKTTGAFELTPIMQSLEPFHDRLLVLSGMNSPISAVSSPHSRAATAFLTGFPPAKTSGGGGKAGPSLDQLVAKHFGEQTQLPSLELGLDNLDAAGLCDGNPCIMGNTISWHTDTLPLPPENNPRLVFERLFGDVGSTESGARMAHLRQDRSILDSVMDESADLQRRLGADDRSRLTEYLEGVRDIETRIQKAEAQSAKDMPVVTQPAGIPATFEEHAKLMFDLQVLAYQSDLTRVVTYMYGREFSGRAYPEIGVPEGHHPLSHHQYDKDKLASLAKLNTYHVQMFAYFLDKMSKTKDGDGSLLDHTLLMYGAGMSDSNVHSPVGIPVMLVGGPNQGIKGGRHLKYDGDSSANLLVAVMDKLGLPAGRIGASRGKLDLDQPTVV